MLCLNTKSEDSFSVYDVEMKSLRILLNYLQSDETPLFAVDGRFAISKILVIL